MSTPRRRIDRGASFPEPLKQRVVLHFVEMGSRWIADRGADHALLFELAAWSLNADQIVEELALLRKRTCPWAEELRDHREPRPPPASVGDAKGTSTKIVAGPLGVVRTLGTRRKRARSIRRTVASAQPAHRRRTERPRQRGWIVLHGDHGAAHGLVRRRCRDPGGVASCALLASRSRDRAEGAEPAGPVAGGLRRRGATDDSEDGGRTIGERSQKT